MCSIFKIAELLRLLPITYAESWKILVFYTYVVLQVYNLTWYIFTANFNIAHYWFGVGAEETVEESSWGINWSVDLLWFMF